MRLKGLFVALAVLLVSPPADALQPRQRPSRDGAAPQQGPRRPRVKKRRRRPPNNKPSPKPAQPAEDLDRAVIRWYARSTGGIAAPQFITARELAFEARLEALTSHSTRSAPYTNKDIRSAVQRHISEEMLASLPVSQKPTPKQVASYAEAARELIAQRIASDQETMSTAQRRDYGLIKLDAARRAEGISREELDALLRRRARASWYLDKMVAPMLKPTDLDLREAHRRGETPFTSQPFDEAKGAIERWYVSARVAAALEQYFRNIRSRVRVIVISRPLRAEPVAPKAPKTKTARQKPAKQKARGTKTKRARRRRGRRTL